MPCVGWVLFLVLATGCRAVDLGQGRVRAARQALKVALADAARDEPAVAAIERREFFATTASVAAAALARVAAVDASGGATAGGVYLIRAKERYNARVEAGAKDFRGLSRAASSGDAATMAAFFTSESYEDLCSAGFLLANAFRSNSTQNPDKIPQVKLFKAFQKEADAAAALLKKRKVAESQEAYARALAALDAYMAAVGL